MIPVSSAAGCQRIDRALISDVGVSGLALMEIASRGVAVTSVATVVTPDTAMASDHYPVVASVALSLAVSAPASQR